MDCCGGAVSGGESMEEVAIYFTEEQFDQILKYMEDQGKETVQEAVMDAIKWGKYHHDYCE